MRRVPLLLSLATTLALSAYLLWPTPDHPPLVDLPDPARPGTDPAVHRVEPPEHVAAAPPERAPGASVARPDPEGAPARARRDQMRDQIAQALRQRYRTPPGEAADGSDEVEDDLPPGNLDKTYIRDTVREQLVPLVQECYDAALQDDPESGGRLVMQFDIMGDESVGGIVDDVQLTDDSDRVADDFAECVRESMTSVTFDPPRGGGVVRVTYPLIFEPA